jgi:hypothetical protein
MSFAVFVLARVTIAAMKLEARNPVRSAVGKLSSALITILIDVLANALECAILEHTCGDRPFGAIIFCAHTFSVAVHQPILVHITSVQSIASIVGGVLDGLFHHSGHIKAAEASMLMMMIQHSVIESTR